MHFVHQHAPPARKTGNLFWLLKKLLRCIFFGTYVDEECYTEWNDCLQHEEEFKIGILPRKNRP